MRTPERGRLDGALTGSIIGNLVDPNGLTMFVVIGVAAFLGAGYRVPLAAVALRGPAAPKASRWRRGTDKDHVMIGPALSAI